jgi:class 3 adenylate cyclase
MFLRLVLLAFIAHCFSSALSATQINPETGAFFFREYSPKTYGGAPQNWAVVQDRRGVIYVGNNEGILEYDGQKWRKLKLPNLSVVRSLAVDARGTVYVGGQAEIGFLKANNTGTLQYVSLLDHIDPQDRLFNDVWTTLTTRSGVVFSSNQRLFRWSPERGMKVWRPSSSFSAAFVADDVAYVIEKGSGLYRLVEDSLQPVPGGEIFSRSTFLRGAFRFMGSMMVATPECLYVQKNTRFEEYETEAKTLLRESRIYKCLPLRDGTLAIGTIHRGVVFLSEQGKILRVLNGGASGLHDSSINSMYCDREGGLWLALNNGLARVEVTGPATYFAERDGLAEIVASIQRHDGVLYVGTVAGLSRLVPNRNGNPRFEPVPGIHGQVVTLKSTRHGLLMGALDGLYELTKNGVRELSSPKGFIDDLALSGSNPSTVYAAGRSGLFVLHLHKGQWQQTLYIDSGGQEFLTVAEEPDGHVWATTLSDIWRFELRSNPIGVERFPKQQGVPPGRKYAFRLRDSVVFATGQGLMRFDPRTRRFVADTSFGSEFASRPVTIILETPGGDIWITGKGYHCVLRPNNSGGYTSDQNVLGNWGITKPYALYVDADRTVWAAGMDGGVVRYEQPTTSRENSEFDAVLREVQIGGRERTVFGGAEALATTPKLRYQENALHFDFAAPHFEGVSEIEFRVLLQGLDRNWSPWTTQAEKEYTNLWESHYVFHVQARDSKGRVSRESIFAFRVLPPVYRTWWAYLLYAVLALTIVWLIVRWRLLSIEAQNRRLESIICERTKEIRQQRDEIRFQEERTESLLLNILPAAVAQELRTTGAVTPLSCDDITVCFSDFVGFTLSSEKMHPAELIAALNRYFTEFDQIVDDYHLEKIKTIGDSYMFVSGLPEAKASHAVDAVLAALEMVEAVRRLSAFSPGWQIRLGLHSGPAVAGVVGRRKFAFDIWGKTVNLASRHESSGQPNRVNISAQTYELVRDFFHCEPRGQVLIKEKRYLEMYLVCGIRPDLCSMSSTADAYLFDDLYRERFKVRPPGLPHLNRMAASISS